MNLPSYEIKMSTSEASALADWLEGPAASVEALRDAALGFASAVRPVLTKGGQADKPERVWDAHDAEQLRRETAAIAEDGSLR